MLAAMTSCARRAFSARRSSSVVRSATEADPGTGGLGAIEDADDNDDAADWGAAGFGAGLAAGFAAGFASTFAVAFAVGLGARLDHGDLFQAAHSSAVYSSPYPCFG